MSLKVKGESGWAVALGVFGEPRPSERHLRHFSISSDSTRFSSSDRPPCNYKFCVFIVFNGPKEVVQAL